MANNSEASFNGPSGEAEKEVAVSVPEQRARSDQRQEESAQGEPSAPDERELLTAADVGRTVARMAHQIIERTAGDVEPSRLVLMGIPTRGTILAGRLAAAIADFGGTPPVLGSLDITLYRDDLRSRPHRPLERTCIPDGGIDAALVVLVDDVLFSGRTVRAALDGLRDLGRPRVVQLAVLVDRGHRELPIRADFVGKNIPTARGEEVSVRLSEHDGLDGVYLRRRAS